MVEPIGLRIDVSCHAGVAELCLWGELDADSASSLVAEGEQLVAQGRRHLVLDCAAVTFCDSFGLGAMTLLLDLVRPGGSVILARPSKLLARLIGITQLANRFQIPGRTLEAFALEGQVDEPSGVDPPEARQWDLAAIEAQRLSERLAGALNDQIVIEQAKGVVSERTGLDMDQCFSVLCDHAANHHVRLVDVAQDVVDGRPSSSTLDPLY